MTAPSLTDRPSPTSAPERFVVVVDETLAPGLAANATAVLAFTLGARFPDLLGPELVDGDGATHPGLIPFGLPILRASADALAGLHADAVAAGVGVVALPAFAQQTTDYGEFAAHVARTAGADLRPLALALHGPRRQVRTLTGSLGLLR